MPTVRLDLQRHSERYASRRNNFSGKRVAELIYQIHPNFIASYLQARNMLGDVIESTKYEALSTALVQLLCSLEVRCTCDHMAA